MKRLRPIRTWNEKSSYALRVRKSILRAEIESVTRITQNKCTSIRMLDLNNALDYD